MRMRMRIGRGMGMGMRMRMRMTATMTALGSMSKRACSVLQLSFGRAFRSEHSQFGQRRVSVSPKPKLFCPVSCSSWCRQVGTAQSSWDDLGQPSRTSSPPQDLTDRYCGNNRDNHITTAGKNIDASRSRMVTTVVLLVNTRLVKVMIVAILILILIAISSIIVVIAWLHTITRNRSCTSDQKLSAYFNRSGYTANFHTNCSRQVHT